MIDDPKDNSSPEVSTFVSDPFGIPSADAQKDAMAQDEEALNREIEAELRGEDTGDEERAETSDEAEQADRIEELDPAKLERLSETIARMECDEGLEAHDEDVLLKSQIAEEEALQEELNREAQEELRTALPLIEDQTDLESSLEALLFVSDKPLTLDRLHEMLSKQVDRDKIEEALLNLGVHYQDARHGIELMKIAGGYQFTTKPIRADLLKKLSKTQVQRLSSGAMETLSIIAYRQPAMKEEIDRIRGVDSSYFLRVLLDRKLVFIAGRSDLPGRPMLYNTTDEFLQLFGLNNVKDLPSLREIEQMIPASEVAKEVDSPEVQKMRKMVLEMSQDENQIPYDSKEDEKFLTEIRERIKAIPTSSPSIEAQKEAEKLAAAALANPLSNPLAEPLSTTESLPEQGSLTDQPAVPAELTPEPDPAVLTAQGSDPGSTTQDTR